MDRPAACLSFGLQAGILVERRVCLKISHPRHRRPFWWMWLKNRGSSFTWWFNQLPGPSIFPKGTPMGPVVLLVSLSSFKKGNRQDWRPNSAIQLVPRRSGQCSTSSRTCGRRSFAARRPRSNALGKKPRRWARGRRKGLEEKTYPKGKTETLERWPPVCVFCF